jgi:DNA-binding beta-propeller fold protein YncE
MPAVLLALALLAAGAPTAARAEAAAAAAAAADSIAAPALALRFELRDTLAGGGRDRLVEPAGVTTDAFGRVYVTDAALNRLSRWDAEGRWLDEAGTLGSEANQFRRPGAAARLGSLGVAVLDVENRRVVTWDLEMQLLGVLTDLNDGLLAASIGPVSPVSLAADRGGAVYLADADGDRVLTFDFAGRYLRELGGHGQGEGRFAGLAAVAASPRGLLVAVDRPAAAASAGARVQWFDSSGRPVGESRTVLAGGKRRGRPGRLAVAVDDSARVAVADEATGTLELLGRSRELLARLDGLARPVALAFAPDGSLLVAEAGAARVRRFVPLPAATEK